MTVDRSNGQNRGTVLVVDDNVPLRLITEMHLSEAGFSVFSAGNVDQAFEVLRTLRPDAIVSDVYMPRTDGFEFCRRLRQQPGWASTFVVLVSSGTVESMECEAAAAAGADRYLERSTNCADLIACLDAVCRRKCYTGAAADTR